MSTACFTGHRKLNGQYYNQINPSVEWYTLKEYLNTTLRFFMVNSIDHYISGLAIGVDMLGAECVAHARSTVDFDVRLTGAMPFPSQASRWPANTRQHWEYVCSLCNEVVSTSPDPYHPSKMQIRNIWMVDNSDYVIAIWNGTRKGGTWNCMEYAQSTNKPIFCVQYLGGNNWQGVWLKEAL